MTLHCQCRGVWKNLLQGPRVHLELLPGLTPAGTAFVLFLWVQPQGCGEGGQCSLRALTLTWLLAVPLQGNTGMLMGMFLVSFVALVALVTVLSGIGVGEHCGVGSGGVYSMIASVLGGQTGGTIGLLYVFGQVRPPASGIHFPCLAVFTFLSSTFPFAGGQLPEFYRWAIWSPGGDLRAEPSPPFRALTLSPGLLLLHSLCLWSPDSPRKQDLGCHHPCSPF